MSLYDDIRAEVEMALCDNALSTELMNLVVKLSTIYLPHPSYALYTKFVSSNGGGAAPSQASLISAFGAFATVGKGFMGIHKNTNGAAVLVKARLITTDGIKYYYTTVTKAA